MELIQNLIVLIVMLLFIAGWVLIFIKNFKYWKLGVFMVVATTLLPPLILSPESFDISRNFKGYYENCTDAKYHGAAPLYENTPGYRKALDRDGDGIACEY